ncbi:Mismatch repair protein msh3 [Diaporthe australafricana]|uniref:Mismatch repair protein msh3 n=1 Tax=Diaporthe australafricana TaxID=127596 RepID=A0ABR3VV52_9PEZI
MSWISTHDDPTKARREEIPLTITLSSASPTSSCPAGATPAGRQHALTLRDSIQTRVSERDSLVAGESTFMVEVSETAAILRASLRHAVLGNFVRETRCLPLCLPHYQNIANISRGMGGLVRNVHMRFTVKERERYLTHLQGARTSVLSLMSPFFCLDSRSASPQGGLPSADLSTRYV